MNPIAKIWAEEVMSGRRTIQQVPRLLKEKVLQIINSNK